MLFLVRLLLIMSLGLNLEASIAAADIVDQFVYSGFSGSNLTMDGTATITSDGFLQLSNGTAYLKGHGFHPSPLRLRESSNGTVRSFSVTFVFGIVSSYADFSAHGMAFFIAPTTNFSTTLPAKYLGLTNVQNNGNASNRLFAVELDTIQSVEFKDINANHVGIDINGLESLRSYNAGYYDDKSGAFQNLKLISRQAMQVWVDYNGKTKQINVTLAPLRMTRPLRPLLSTVYDLSTVLTDVVYLGFSAATGRVNSLHCVLGWVRDHGPRFHVIKGVASGLLYLHEGWEKVVIHRDIKASNVLLAKDTNGQLGDFGLARLYDHGTDTQSTHVVGTMGYLSPELVRTGKASPLTDVFAFGVFLLELTCGQKPIKENVQGSGHTVLADWVLQHWCNGSLMVTVDRRLQGDYNVEEAELVLKLGLMCSHPFPNARPGMGQVVRYLDGVVPLPELTPTDLSFDMPAMMQNKEFGMSSYPDLVTSFGTISSREISGGR
ncbi:hypothetical protein QOZ80_6AG0517990 [Eleusine coracana subsp. coracana]|nr:hypothetical protein QOZ80_6AG0517990 [Eleusine coracana subsp. coracana]